MSAIEVNQTIYVHRRNMFSGDEENLTPYTVTKVNTRSIYTKRVGSDYEWRFDKKTLKACDMGISLQAYLTEQEYWDKVNEKREKERLIRDIEGKIKDLSLEGLKQVQYQVNLWS